MNIGFLACSVFEHELGAILKEIKDKQLFDVNLNVDYLPFGLHVNLEELEKAIKDELDKLNYDKIIVLYGSKCHYDFENILKGYENIITIKPANCLEAIIGDKVVESYSTNEKIYLTPGWVERFDELNKFSGAVDNYDVLHQFGSFENAVIGDTGVTKITDEDIFDLYEKIQIPIEVESTDINIFKNLIFDAIKEAINS